MRTVMLTLWIVAATMTAPESVWAQYMFMDVDGDGAPTATDHLARAGTTSIDIWLHTDQGRDGRRATPAVDGAPVSILSYEIALRAEGGTIEWVSFTNRQESMTVPFRKATSPSEFYIGFGGTEPIAPGKVKLGTLVCRAASGSPRIEFLPRSMIKPGGRTSFGSKNPGKDNDNTLKLGCSPFAPHGRTESEDGDWTDADGVGAANRSDGPLLEARADGHAIAFGARVVRGEGRSNLLLKIATTVDGFLRIRLFDTRGRLVRTIADLSEARAGTRAFIIDRRGGPGPRLARGVYAYRIDAQEGAITGKVVFVD